MTQKRPRSRDVYPAGDFFFKVTTVTRVRFIREGEKVTALEFTFGPGEEPMRVAKVR